MVCYGSAIIIVIFHDAIQCLIQLFTKEFGYLSSLVFQRLRVAFFMSLAIQIHQVLNHWFLFELLFASGEESIMVCTLRIEAISIVKRAIKYWFQI